MLFIGSIIPKAVSFLIISSVELSSQSVRLVAENGSPERITFRVSDIFNSKRRSPPPQMIMASDSSSFKVACRLSRRI